MKLCSPQHQSAKSLASPSPPSLNPPCIRAHHRVANSHRQNSPNPSPSISPNTRLITSLPSSATAPPIFPNISLKLNHPQLPVLNICTACRERGLSATVQYGRMSSAGHAWRLVGARSVEREEEKVCRVMGRAAREGRGIMGSGVLWVMILWRGKREGWLISL